MKKFFVLILVIGVNACGGGDDAGQPERKLITATYIDERIRYCPNDYCGLDELIYNPLGNLEMGATFQIVGSELVASYPIGDDCYSQSPELFAHVSRINEDPFRVSLYSDELMVLVPEDCDGSMVVQYDLSEVINLVSDYFEFDSGMIEIVYPLGNGAGVYEIE